MLKLSTGLRDAMLGTSSLASALANGYIKIYTGTVPATADAALAGDNTLLCTISVSGGGAGLTLGGGSGAPSGGVMGKTSTEAWSGVNSASGVATFYRHVAPTDDGSQSSNAARIQGSVATSGADMNLTSTALSSGATQTINFYSVALPTL